MALLHRLTNAKIKQPLISILPKTQAKQKTLKKMPDKSSKSVEILIVPKSADKYSQNSGSGHVSQLQYLCLTGKTVGLFSV